MPFINVYGEKTKQTRLKAGSVRLSTKWLCHFVEAFPRCTARWLRHRAAVCSGKVGISSKFLRKSPHMPLIFDLQSEDRRSIRLNRRHGSLPFPRLVSPASSDFASSAAGGAYLRSLQYLLRVCFTKELSARLPFSPFGASRGDCAQQQEQARLQREGT